MVFWLLPLFWLLLCRKRSSGSGNSSEVSDSSITSMSAAVRGVDDGVARRLSAFTRSSASSAFLMACGVGWKTDDLKTCLSLKSTAFLHVGPGLQKESVPVQFRPMASYRVEIRLSRPFQTLVRARHHDRCTRVNRRIMGLCWILQLAVVGNRGTTQL